MIITIDFETYYSRDYSLSKISEVEYIRDKQFQTIGAAIKRGEGPITWHVGHAAVADEMRQIDWTKAGVLSHNMRFDGAILAWHYGVIPAFYFDTLSMARAMTHSIAKKSSLASLAKYFQLPEKGGAVHSAMGKRLEHFHPHDLHNYGEYCRHDTWLCHEIFRRMLPKFPKDELFVIDLTQRMYIQPQMMLLQDVLQMHLDATKAERARILSTVVGIDKITYSSNAQFAELLRSEGVDVPMKRSPADPSKEIPALARGDRGFQELLADDTQSPRVQALLAARVQAKSTIEETRTEKMLAFSKVDWGGQGAWIPAPLRYYGAHTGRFSGDGGFNLQNLKRDSAIKNGIVAPPGYVIVARDASQIEARMVAWMANQMDLIDDFANGVDIYSKFASMVFNRPVTKANKVERFVGKTCILGLGYGMGAERFRHTLFIGSGGVRTDVDIGEAERIVHLYRKKYAAIPNLWQNLGYLLDVISSASRGDRVLANDLDGWIKRRIPAAIYPGFDSIWLPNGMPIAYPGLRWETDDQGQREMLYDSAYGPSRMFGGKATENISQALSRIVITDIMRRVWKERRRHPTLQVHDSLIYVVPEAEAEEFDAYLDAQFAIRPWWAPTLPLASEGHFGATLMAAEGKG